MATSRCCHLGKAISLPEAGEARGGRQVQVQSLPEGIQLATTPEQTHEMPQRRETLSLYLLRKRLQRHVRLEKTHKNSYRSSTLQVQFVREIVHPALFTGKPLPQSTRGGAPVRLQAKEVKDVRLR